MAQSIDLSTRDSFNHKEQLKGVSENSATEFIVFPNIEQSELDSTNLSENENELNKYRTLTRSIVAFLNRHGGRIYIGINKKTKTVVGVSDNASDYIKDVINHLIREISPNPNLSDKKVKIDFLPISDTENYVVKVVVRRGEGKIIYSTKPNAFSFYWRNDESIEPYTLDQYRSEFEKRIEGKYVPKEIPLPDWEDVNPIDIEHVEKLEEQPLIIETKPGEIQKQSNNSHQEKEQLQNQKQVGASVANNELKGKDKRQDEDEEEEVKRHENEHDEIVIPHLLSEPKSATDSLKVLPITSYKDKILKTIYNFPITLVRGRTGSGKTTQIPQYLAKSKQFTGKIALAQPFKESLPSIVQRIKEEYGEKPDIISTMHDENASQYNSKIHVMTHETLIYQLLFNPDLQKYSCIIIDEAHERYIDTEMLLTFLMYLFREKLISNIKIIFASATLDVDSFKKFLKEEEISFDFIDIPGTQYPVQEHWKICKFAHMQIPPRKKKLNPDEEEEKCDDQFIADIYLGGEEPMVKFAEGAIPSENSSPQAARLIIQKLIREDYKKLTGHVLVFVPRAEDTKFLSDHFKTIKEINRIFDIMPFHGNLTLENAQKIFNEPSEGKQYKLIFSTKVGQTAITINDLFVVIDSGWDVVRMYNRKTESTLEEYAFISQSQSKQRMGRLGRTRPGHFLPLYSSKDFEEMEKYEMSVMEKFNLQKPILWILRMKRNAFTMKFLEKCPYVERKYVENLLIRMNQGLIRQFKESKIQDLSQRVRSLNMTITDDEELFLTLLFKDFKNIGPLPKDIQKKFEKIFEASLSDIENKNIHLTNFKWLEKKMGDRFNDNLIRDAQFLMNYGLVKYIDIESKFHNLKSCVLTELGSFASEKDIFPNQIKTLYESIVYNCTEKVCRALSILENDWKLFEANFKPVKQIKAQWSEKSEFGDFTVYLQISEAYDEELNDCLTNWAKELSLTDDKIIELYENSIHFSDFKTRVINELLRIMEQEELDPKCEAFKHESKEKLEDWAKEKYLSLNALELAQTKLEFYINLTEHMRERLTFPKNQCEVTFGVRNMANQKMAIRLTSEFGQNNIEILREDVHGYKLKLRVGSQEDLANQTLKIGINLGDHLTEEYQRFEEISLDKKEETIEHGNNIYSFKFKIEPFSDSEENLLKCFFFGYVTSTAIQKRAGQNSFEILRLGYGTRVDKAPNELELGDSTSLNTGDKLLKIIISPQTRGRPGGTGIFTSYSFTGQYASLVDEQWFYELQEPGANYRRYLEKAREEPNESESRATRNGSERGSGIVRNQANAKQEVVQPRLGIVNNNSGRNNQSQSEGIKRSDKKRII